MLIKGLFSNLFGDPQVAEIQKTVKDNSNLTDVSSEPITRGDNTISIKGVVYEVAEFDAAVAGDAAALYQTTDGVLAVAHAEDGKVDYDAITPTDKKEDTNVSKFAFKKQSEMPAEKVAGTSFSTPHKYTDFQGEIEMNDKNVPALKTQAVLMPDPTNEYDPHAVQVLAPLKTGKAERVGFLAKNGKLYQKVKQPTAAKLTIVAYSENGNYNDSYLIEL